MTLVSSEFSIENEVYMVFFSSWEFAFSFQLLLLFVMFGLGLVVCKAVIGSGRRTFPHHTWSSYLAHEITTLMVWQDLMVRAQRKT